MKILGIETSCDDTGISIIEGKTIIANEVISQRHILGIIPEFAAREHHLNITNLTRKIIAEHDVDLIAYTNGPGLIGSLFIGSSFAKALAYSKNIPCIGVNHLEAHIILPYWHAEIEFPYLCLLISGGHTMLILVKKLGDYEIVSTTLDDAVGETFDKVARSIGLPYPGGPEIEKLAATHKSEIEFLFPIVMKHSNDFSFSGLKTAAIEQISQNSTQEEKAAFAFYFQKHIANILIEKMGKIAKTIPGIKTWVASGGVAANKTIRNAIIAEAKNFGAVAHFPPIELCTDNGLMIAALGQLKFEQTKQGTSFSLKPDAQWKFALKTI